MKYKIFKTSGHTIELQPLPSDIDPTNGPLVEGQAEFLTKQLPDANDWKRIQPIGVEIANWVNSKNEHYMVTCDD